jgi:hypothetical protein
MVRQPLFTLGLMHAGMTVLWVKLLEGATLSRRGTDERGEGYHLQVTEKPN